MTTTDTATRSLVIDRQLPVAPAKVWRALTEGPLLTEWLMANDFRPEVGHRFTFRSTPAPNWDGIIQCEVLTVEPPSRLAYSWSSMGLKSVVTFTLTAAASGTQLRMEQSGFPAQGGDQYFKGAQYGWSSFLTKLDGVVGGLA
ncbi:MAG TPA: SRPBCC domain-containing protein [Polyangiaceae bacterium]|jgi:uncharacterized protein YndB with AHSA1/START domain